MPNPQETPVAILCGGRGTRMGSAEGSAPPKPLAEVAGRAMLGHVIEIFTSQGFRDILLATGHRGAEIEAWLEGETWPPGVTVDCLETGEEASSGDRVARVGEHLGGGRFLLGYSDGLADLDVTGLLDFHDAHGAMATMTVVRPELQFGLAVLGGTDGTSVVAFDEKPPVDGWVNGGFFVFEGEVDEYLTEGSALEREPLSALAAAGQLRAFKHEGFWRCLDTPKDLEALERVSGSGTPPWLSPRGEVTPDLGR